MDLNDLDIFALLIAAIAHDFKHNGVTNTFHVNFKTDIATTYNGKLYFRKLKLKNIFSPYKKLVNFYFVQKIIHKHSNLFLFFNNFLSVIFG